MPQLTPNRIVIYAKDISNITGRKERAARKLIARIRKKYEKANGDFITVHEFCEFTRIPLDSIQDFLKN